MKEIFNSGVLKLLVIFLFGGGAIFVLGIQDMKDSTTVPIDYNNTSISNLKNGDIIEGDIHYSFGAYESITRKRNGKTEGTSFRYVIPVGEKDYIGIDMNRQDMIDSMEKLTNETFDYIQQKSDSTETVVHFKGKIYKMNKEDLGYYNEYLKEGGFSDEEIQNNCYELYIQNRVFGEYKIVIPIGAILFIIGVVILVMAIKKGKAGQAAPIGTPYPSQNIEVQPNLKVDPYAYPQDNSTDSNYTDPYQ